MDIRANSMGRLLLLFVFVDPIPLGIPAWATAPKVAWFWPKPPPI